MILKVEQNYQLVGFIEDAETKRISLVGHAANEMPFAVVKSEDGVAWVSTEQADDKLNVEFKALASKVKIAPVSIKFPADMKEEDVNHYMERFEGSSFTTTKSAGVITANSNVFVDTEGTRTVILPSGIVYTLNKFNVSDTIKSEKETSEMSKKTQKKSEAVAEQVNSKDELIAALKGLSHEDMVAILDEVLPEDTKDLESKEEADSGDKEGTEEPKESEANTEATEEAGDEPKEGVKEEEAKEIAEDSKAEVEKSDKLSEDFITALTEEFESQSEITKKLTDDVISLAKQVEELTAKFNEASVKVEKSLDQEEAVEIIAELQKSLNTLEGRVDSLEYTPADSEVVEKSAEVSEKGKGFLKKYL